MWFDFILSSGFTIRSLTGVILRKYKTQAESKKRYRNFLETKEAKNNTIINIPGGKKI
jgi:hypothetical protein